MAKHRQLAHPPLRESLIDIRLAEELPASAINEMAGKTLTGFGAPVQIWRGNISLPIQVGPTVAVPTPVVQRLDEAFGWRHTSNDASRIVQFRRDGATFSVTQGYTNWQDAREVARGSWQQFCEWGKPSEVSRVALRYINVLAVPTGADFDLYLTAGPRVPPGMPEVLSGFLHRVVIPVSMDGTFAIVTQALEQSNDSNIAAILDIDVFRNLRCRADSKELWTALDTLREIKNRIFFGSVTEKALEYYQ